MPKHADAQSELAQVREERDALQAERDALSAKIDDAQVRLNAILEKLPRAKARTASRTTSSIFSAPTPHDPHDARACGEMHDESHRHGENA